MKKVFCIFWAFVWLTSLMGCAVEANPGGTALPSGSPQPDNSQASDPAADTAWNDDPFRALIPEPDTEWTVLAEEVYGAGILMGNMDQDGFDTLAAQLKDSGFSIDSAAWSYSDRAEGLDYFNFAARDGKGNFVVLTPWAEFQNAGEEKPEWVYEFWIGNNTLRENAGLVPPAEAEKSTGRWEDHGWSSLVPAPPTEYWSVSTQPTHDLVRLDYVSYEQLKTYAQELRDAGFTLQESVSIIPNSDYFKFMAKNESGYTVVLQKIELASSGLLGPCLLIMPPESKSWADWDELGMLTGYLPEPPASNWSHEQNMYQDILWLDGMDYQSAKKYAEDIKAFTVAGKSELDLMFMHEQMQEDAENEKFVYRIQTPDDTVLVLTYDASEADEPCVLTIRKSYNIPIYG